MDPLRSPLLTDLYQLTMLESYYERDMVAPATFELYARKLPPHCGYLIAAGLEQALDWLEQLRFGPEELAWLDGSGLFKPRFIERLADWRFTGEAYALPEGTALFPDEPLLQITAPLPEAQLVESRLMNLVQFQTLVATRAARVVEAAQGRRVVDFGMRRAHGAEAALFAARATYLAGFDATATVLAGAEYGIPVTGTMAHSYILAFAEETEAFKAFIEAHPDKAVLLIDTYDTEAAAAKVVELARQGYRASAVRLDSGDLADHARQVRRILDDGGLTETLILASGDLDEYAVAEMVGQGVPIDGFGLGTRIDTASEQPFLECAYKLMAYAGEPRRKRSEGKGHWAGRKQIWRHHDAQGRVQADTLGLAEERPPAAAEPLLQCAMRDGERLVAPESLDVIRRRTRESLRRLPGHCRDLQQPTPITVHPTDALKSAARRADRVTGYQGP
ncbi:nicotinate phosphoribosyltransferase [Alkalilimnicola ehrlichii MLHE-1]|uniref:Nicotinate phosphoribosyltransferase n=1 Tax=Alkalilimnicola ehrlichii (strain ATCC BAA-1101 / DSM 17681 / MLHE-1) TaxID=187272 RepID=Q0A760_ALKEH|nr:nicotinate phosphoribosyltransferase [Alkalilimnicola ehrlichii]ABI57327.1 putative nicotinate phosphoribosyltransferase [Alkalilimnicola ehrlichii MLHE-1]